MWAGGSDRACSAHPGGGERDHFKCTRGTSSSTACVYPQPHGAAATHHGDADSAHAGSRPPDQGAKEWSGAPGLR